MSGTTRSWAAVAAAGAPGAGAAAGGGSAPAAATAAAAASGVVSSGGEGGAVDELPAPSDELMARWRAEQEALRDRLELEDRLDFDSTVFAPPAGEGAEVSASPAAAAAAGGGGGGGDAGSESGGRGPLRFVGGVDISFVKGSADKACASLVVLALPKLDVVFSQFEMVRLTEPYVSGFLAFREVGHLAPLVEDLRRERPDIFPQVILVDGNGVLHQRGFGLAAHLGVLCDVPTIGIGKSSLVVDGLTLERYKELGAGLTKGGEHAPLVGDSGRTWGALLRGSDGSKHSMCVSSGHRISLDTALRVVVLCTPRYKLPEPIRAADLLSRAYLRDLEQKKTPGDT